MYRESDIWRYTTCAVVRWNENLDFDVEREIAETKDIVINLRHIMDFGQAQFKAYIVNNGKMVSSMKELVLTGLIIAKTDRSDKLKYSKDVLNPVYLNGHNIKAILGVMSHITFE